MLKDLVLSNRSCRRFHQEIPIIKQILIELVDLGRLSASSKNIQPLKYIYSCDKKLNAAIFPHLRWAAGLPDWDGPEEGERPAAYIVILLDKTIADSASCDHAIAAQSILLGARERGFNGCMIASIKREELSKTLGLSDRYKVELVIALGKTKETVIVDEIEDNSTSYWRDDKNYHHVPKRSMKEVLLEANLTTKEQIEEKETPTENKTEDVEPPQKSIGDLFSWEKIKSKVKSDITQLKTKER